MHRPSLVLAFIVEAICWLSEGRATAVNRSALIWNRTDAERHISD